MLLRDTVHANDIVTDSSIFANSFAFEQTVHLPVLSLTCLQSLFDTAKPAAIKKGNASLLQLYNKFDMHATRVDVFFFIRNGSFCLNLRCFDAEFKFFYLCIVSFLCTLCTIFCTSRWWHKSFCLSFCNRDRRHGWTLVLQRKLYCCSILIIFFLSFSLSSAMHSASPWHARGDIYMDSCRPKRLN